MPIDLSDLDTVCNDPQLARRELTAAAALLDEKRHELHELEQVRHELAQAARDLDATSRHLFAAIQAAQHADARRNLAESAYAILSSLWHHLPDRDQVVFTPGAITDAIDNAREIVAARDAGEQEAGK